MTEKPVETPKVEPAQPIEAFPSKEAHIDAMLTKTLEAAAAEQAKLEVEKPTEVEIKPTEATPKAKEIVEPAPEPEPKISALDRFKADAAKESEGRVERQKVKEWKDKYSALEGEIGELRALKEQLRTDPLSFFEKHMPTETYEQLTRMYANGEKPSPENTRFAALEKKLDTVIGELKTTREENKSQGQNNWFKDYMNEVNRLVMLDDFKSIGEYSAQYEKLTGNPVNIQQAVAKEYDDFEAMYKKRLTPRETLEILNEKAEERLSNNRPETPAAEKKPEPKPAKKPAQTLINALETESDSQDDTIPFAGDRESHLQGVIDRVGDKLWQGNPEK